MKLLEFLLNLNSLPSDFSSPFFSPGCSRGKNFQFTLLLNVHWPHLVAAGIWADSLATFNNYFPFVPYKNDPPPGQAILDIKKVSLMLCTCWRCRQVAAEVLLRLARSIKRFQIQTEVDRTGNQNSPRQKNLICTLSSTRHMNTNNYHNKRRLIPKNWKEHPNHNAEEKYEELRPDWGAVKKVVNKIRDERESEHQATERR